VTAVIAAASAIVLVMAALGIHDLQPRLERWDYQRHFDD
jgi:hypothetical protein